MYKLLAIVRAQFHIIITVIVVFLVMLLGSWLMGSLYLASRAQLILGADRDRVLAQLQLAIARLDANSDDNKQILQAQTKALQNHDKLLRDNNRILKNQLEFAQTYQTIVDNQHAIVANEQRILNNQQTIVDNQKKYIELLHKSAGERPLNSLPQHP